MSYMQQLYEMAMSRSMMIDFMESFSVPYRDHLLKCIIYKDSTGNLYHWINELAEMLYKVNKKISKNNNYKLDERVYKDYFLLAAGDTEEEWEDNLIVFKNKFKHKYPNFNIPPKLISLTYNIVTDLAEYFSPILSTKNEYTKEKFQQKLIEYFGDIL